MKLDKEKLKRVIWAFDSIKEEYWLVTADQAFLDLCKEQLELLE